MSLYRKILFATDFSEAAAHALDYAVELARRFGAELHVVHVLGLHQADPVDAEARLPEAVPAALDDVVASRTLVRSLKPELGILHAAREVDADLIVVGTHGASALRHMLLGSVAERVVQLSPMPVLTVRQPGHAFEHP